MVSSPTQREPFVAHRLNMFLRASIQVHTYPALGQRLYHQPTDVATRYPPPINTSGSNENETTWEPEEALLRYLVTTCDSSRCP